MGKLCNLSKGADGTRIESALGALTALTNMHGCVGSIVPSMVLVLSHLRPVYANLSSSPESNCFSGMEIYSTSSAQQRTAMFILSYWTGLLGAIRAKKLVAVERSSFGVEIESGAAIPASPWEMVCQKCLTWASIVEHIALIRRKIGYLL
ncbi:hypothetical protein NA56DRAFT_704986 [Hyaloscypha hepaticicola]|uniref:Uncharacterized protein n=1 Tax=Hyaloscypha hepaticicola TaxID=2082293 RepID=A0A2J6Q1M8_9HELO|nr:hypothetical protein NA56DRAFT_704986 [Hyaloscypha hepaticicola]